MHLFLKIIFGTLAIGALIVGSLFVWLSPSKEDQQASAAEKIQWGVDFSETQAEYLGLDPKETYDALITDLGAKNIKIHINWNRIEAKNDTYDFAELDREVKEAEQNHVQLILVIGMKTGRWPECHSPSWTESMSKEELKAELIKYVATIVERYKNSSAVEYWQVENEPMIRFGKCESWYYNDNHVLLQKEFDTVKAIDPTRKIIISDSGELSSWFQVAKIGDIVGITMYRSSWKPGLSTFGINPYAFLSPEIYTAKAALIEKNFGKPVICIELQAEPWASKPLAEASLSEQAKSMNADMFAENIAFAKATGFKSFYFWGAEWWYFMKTKHNDPSIWNEAKQLFAE